MCEGIIGCFESEEFMLVLRECSKSYKNKMVLEHINYALKNEIYWLNGSNGIGKSVFCRCLAGLEKFTSGVVEGKLGNVLYLPETSVADYWLTMMENINLMKYYFKLTLEEEEQKRIIKMLEILEEDELASNVSVGTSLKVGLFLLFVKKHWNTIIIDETLSHIDNHIKETVLKELENRKQEGACVLIIHHGELCTGSMEDPIHELYLDNSGLKEIKRGNYDARNE
jgi:ABC-2 type transport system ATP-binding protein